MKPLVIGSDGFVGKHVTDVLREFGYDSVRIDEGWFDDVDDGTIQRAIEDYSSEELCDLITDNDVTHVIYLAGLSNDPMANYRPALNFYHNLSIPSWVAYLADKCDLQGFVFASSTSVYQDWPLQPYALAKRQAEQCGDTIAIPWLNVRCATLGGYSRRMRFDLCINAMVKSAVTTGVIRCLTPDAMRPLMSAADAAHCYVENMVNNLDHTITAYTEYCSVREIADRVANRLEIHDIDIDVVYGTGKDSRSVPKVQQDWKGLHTIEDMVDQVVENCAYDGVDYEAEKHINILMMEKNIAEHSIDATAN